MISIIICSVDEQLLDKIRKNIESTIGIEYELLVWKNSKEQLGLCQVYNMMAPQAKYPFLCFCHEDISFQTRNWAQTLFNIFNSDASIGLIGVAGSKYKSKSWSGWFTGIDAFDRFSIVHCNKADVERIRSKVPAGNADAVACIDGVFMVCRQEAWRETRFDDQLLRGFHFYDIDFSLRVAQTNTVVVTNLIDIDHFTTGGDFGNNWIKACIDFHRSSKDLPFDRSDAVGSNSIENKIARTWLDRLKSENISFRNRWYWVVKQKLYRYPSLWFSIVVFFCFRLLQPENIAQLFKIKLNE
jgi:hypothetical protein